VDGVGGGGGGGDGMAGGASGVRALRGERMASIDWSSEAVTVLRNVAKPERRISIL
jgi:hypothetical protein